MEERERQVFTWHGLGATGSETENGSVSARLVPYNIADDRPGEWKGKRYTSTVYEPGCFDAWIAEHGTRRTKFMFDHGDAQMPLSGGNEHGTNALPIGTMLSMESHDDGLYFEAAFGGSALAQNVRELASSGGLTDVSFASHVVTADVRADGYRHVTECEVWDASIVVWGQFLENAAIVEVNRRHSPRAQEASHMGGVSTCGAMLEGSVYECVTNLFLDWRQDGIITGPEFVSLSEAATRILSAVQAEIPTDIAARECDDDGFDWWHRAADRRNRNNDAPEHAGADAETSVEATVERTIESEGGEPNEVESANPATAQDRRARLAEFEGYLDDAPVSVPITE